MKSPIGVGLVLAAAGSGTRFGGPVPKQFLEFRGKPLYRMAMEAFEGLVEETALVVPPALEEAVRREFAQYQGLVQVVAGGPTRQESVGRGLAALSSSIDWVLVHDAARPFVSPQLVGAVLAATMAYHACIPAIPVSDTVKEIADSFIVRTLQRKTLRLAQTPQGFRRSLLQDALDKAVREGLVATDEAQLVEAAGGTVYVVPGDPANQKITWARDLATAGTPENSGIRVRRTAQE